jgi:hypothetical protein
MSFFKKRNFTTLGNEKENEVVSEKMKKNINEDDDDIWGLSLPKSSSPSRMSPKKTKAATATRKPTTRKIKTPTKQQTKRSFSAILADAEYIRESKKKDLLEKEKEILPTIFEREQANALLDSITNKDGIRDTISTMSGMGAENMRKMIRYGTDNKKLKTLTLIQKKFLQQLDAKIKTENPHTRMIHEVTRPVAEQLKINWTSRPSSLPRGVIVIVHTHGGFVKSRDLIKYPSDVNDKLESVSTLYLSDIGSPVCNTREDYIKFDEKFIGSFLRGTLEEGISIKDISEKAQEGFKDARFKGVHFNEKKNMLENYFESGVYNLAVSTKTNNIPFLNKNYSCGKTELGYDKHSIQVVDYGLKSLSEIISREPAFDCQNDYSSITTLQLVDELSKVIDDLEHVLIIDTSCSSFTPSIIKELFDKMPDYLSPHKYRKTGLFKNVSPSPKKTSARSPSRKTRREQISTLRPYFPDLVGGKKTKKSIKNNKNKKYKKTMRKHKTRRAIRAGFE